MSVFRTYPFIAANDLLGFISVYRLKDAANLETINMWILGLSDYIFYYISNIQRLDIHESKYIDNLEVSFRRIEDELENADNLSIPLSMVLFSIKNYRRYYNIMGASGIKKLLNNIKRLIKSRLSDHDFSLRFDRHKILIILPGKDKKFAVQFANTLRNDIISTYSTREIQLLITSLCSMYPEDGKDLYSLIDAID